MNRIQCVFSCSWSRLCSFPSVPLAKRRAFGFAAVKGVAKLSQYETAIAPTRTQRSTQSATPPTAIASNLW